VERLTANALAALISAAIAGAACDDVDSCLDSGGAWDGQRSVCVVCRSNEPAAHCLGEHFAWLYEHDAQGFWSLFEAAQTKASACSSGGNVSAFLSLASSVRGNAEVSEAFAEQVEKLLVSNPRCFLDAAERLPNAVLEDLVQFYLLSPIFVPSKQVADVLDEHLGTNCPRVRAALSRLESAR
jgi:hypothetical protein